MTLRPIWLRPGKLKDQLGCGQSDAASWVAASCPRPSKTISGKKKRYYFKINQDLFFFLTSIRIIYFPQSSDYEKI